jgi:ribosomal RNA-processing protein 1
VLKLLVFKIRFARKLAANDNQKRRAAVKGLTAWLTVRSQKSPNGTMEEIEMRKLWRGLFFCMWLADKAPVQHELSMNIAQLVHCFETTEAVRSWLMVCGKTMRGEWGRLDKYRVDKFYTLLRHMIHEVGVCVSIVFCMMC